MCDMCDMYILPDYFFSIMYCMANTVNTWLCVLM